MRATRIPGAATCEACPHDAILPCEDCHPGGHVQGKANMPDGKAIEKAWAPVVDAARAAFAPKARAIEKAFNEAVSDEPVEPEWVDPIHRL
jgi:hypothetical protein